MTTDYRALCAELVDSLHKHTSMWEGHEIDLVARARALLDQPVAEGPTDEELRDMADFDCDFDRYDTTDSDGREGVSWECSDKNLVDYARAVLAHWGRPTPQPVAVSERLPRPEDCDAEGRCWWFSPADPPGDWYLDVPVPAKAIPCYGITHWLPANALPTPEAKP